MIVNIYIILIFIIIINEYSSFKFSKRNNNNNKVSNLSSKSSKYLPLSSRSITSKLNSFEISLLTAFDNRDVSLGFNIATFLPQPFWLLMILLPNSKITKNTMGSFSTILLFSFVHLFIVLVSASQTNGTAPIAEFADVFDPNGNPQAAMIHMMQYPNFVAEEWSHVLTWDLFVGRWIWLDGIERNIITFHSVLLTNLIGPPGLLLHFITCILSGKSLPNNDLK